MTNLGTIEPFHATENNYYGRKGKKLMPELKPTPFEVTEKGIHMASRPSTKKFYFP